MIPIKIKTTGAVLLNDEVQTFVEEKIHRLEKFIDTNDSTNLFEIELETLPARSGALFRAEINFSSNGKVLRTEAKAETLHAALDEAVGELRRRLRHLSTKHRDLLRHGAAQVKEFFKRFDGSKD